ncbi:MAG: lysozyme [Citromicrobium sp.]|nr:MAG: lysozyme [Citromicrobium sp.]
MARRKSRRSGVLLKLVLLVVLAGLGYYVWWQHQQSGWRPDEAAYPDQGAMIGEGDGAVDFEVLKGLGAEFVYLEASRGARGKDANFSRNLAQAQEAGLEVGAIHEFNPCQTADGQSANYVTIVPRDAELLPSAIRLTATADGCSEHVSDAAVQSELLTLVNQIESHTGAPVILAPSEAFEELYRPAARLDRSLWLDSYRDEPLYGGRPWTVWTANPAYATAASETPLRWLVVRP